MIASVKYKSQTLKVDLSKPLDISIPLRGGISNVNAWYVAPPTIGPHKEEGFVGSVKEGGSVNFNDIHFNPHAHVTHTECVGHITKNVHSINDHLKNYFFWTELITVAPEKQGMDFVISKKQLQYALGAKKREAVVIRTLPNTTEKYNRQYSNTNPPYFLEEAIRYLRDKGVEHLLVDLPSVDREKDGGFLKAHKTFWNLDGDIRFKATITEFVYVDNSIEDGRYLLNLQVAPFENDASPSRPLLYGPV
ncbi:cyclase family protein [Muricauda sp. SCSIO 64092]|uniref:cyclase family protein n=1 Tax=Allomuricauda sp. SCSIO 64092 TaxID=2908842 RepID=UPI001FF3BECB|nr:cyclase family protein [Muricauda sp. SCSIO 64092]UOY08125.1 cyclase family protein [Muricauda sp. SCSIO 64092]